MLKANKIYKKCGVLATTLIALGCASPVIDRNNYKTPSEWFLTIRIPDGIKNRLKDPDSAKIRLLAGPKFIHGPTVNMSGYGLCYGVNAKNSFGGYTGEKLFYFVTNGDTISYFINSEESSYIPQNACRFLIEK